MFRHPYLILIILSLFAGSSLAYAAREVKLTTYYPSPNGNYDNLSVKKLNISIVTDGTGSGSREVSCTPEENRRNAIKVNTQTAMLYACIENVTGPTTDLSDVFWTQDLNLLYPSLDNVPFGYRYSNLATGRQFLGIKLDSTQNTLKIIGGPEALPNTDLLTATLANVNIPGATRTFTTAGNVGIGTSAAQYTLDVTSPSNSTARFIGTNVQGTLVDIKGQGNTDIGIRFYKRDNATGWTMGQLSANNNFMISPGVNNLTGLPAAAPIVISYPLGNVGIGQAAPAQKLDVVGSTNISQNLTVGGNATVTGNTTVSGNTTISGTLSFGNTNTGQLKIPVYTGNNRPGCWQEVGCLWVDQN